MRLKYFIRGIGVGVIVTTLILTIAHASSAKKMSDADVIDRAKELGMEFTSLFEGDSQNGESESASNNPTEDTTPSVTETTTDEPVSESVSEGDTSTEVPTEESTTQESTEPITEEKTTEQTTEATTTQPPTTEPETTTQEPSSQEADNNGVIVYQLEIVSGMSSNKVAAAIEAAGIVSSAKELDEFLVSGGYADRIRVGSFSLNSNMSFQDIANTITGR